MDKGGEVDDDEGGETEEEGEAREEEMEREGVRKEEEEAEEEGFSSLGITCSPQMRPRKSVPGGSSNAFGSSTRGPSSITSWMGGTWA